MLTATSLSFALGAGTLESTKHLTQAFNVELWLADHLNTYLRDNNEYRAATRHLFHLGGAITYTLTTS